MKMVHGLKTLVLKLNLILILIFSFNSYAQKTLKVDTVTPSVTDGDFTITPNGTGDIVFGSFSGVPYLTSGVLSVDSQISLTELGYLDGVTSAIQTQLDARVDITGDESISGVKTFTGQFVASSTTTGFRPCPVMTEAQRDAIASPSEGDCVVNSTSLKLNYYIDSQWGEIAGGGGGSAGINFISDDSFENEELNLDSDGGGTESYQLYTASAELYSETNLKYFQVAYTSLSAADTYVRDTYTRTGMDNKQGLFSVWLNLNGDGFTLCLRIDDSSFAGACDENYSVSLIGDGTWKKYEIPFQFGATSVEWEVRNSSYTGDVTIQADKVYVGTLPDGYIQSIDQSHFVGSLYSSVTNCLWTETGDTSWAVFSADADCTYTATGNVEAPSTNIPAVTIPNARTDGYYRIDALSFFQNNNTSYMCNYTLSSSSSYEDQPVTETFTDATRMQNSITGNFKFSSGGDKTIQVLQQTNNASGECQVVANDTRDRNLTWLVHFYPDKNSTIVTQKTELPKVIAYGNDADTISANTEDIPFKTEGEDFQGLWDNSGNTGNNTADAFTPKEDGCYLVTGTVNHNISTGHAMKAYIDGSVSTNPQVVLGVMEGATDTPLSGIVCLNAGQVLTVRSTSAITLAGSDDHQISIVKLPTNADIIGNLKSTAWTCETKYLSSDSSNVTGSTLSDLTKTLKVGKKYKIFGQAMLRVDDGGASFIDITHDGNIIGSAEYNSSSSAVALTKASMGTRAFEATTTSVTFVGTAATTSRYIQGDGTADETWAEVCELPDNYVIE